MVKLVEESYRKSSKKVTNPYESGALDNGLHLSYEELTKETYTVISRILSSLANFTDTAVWLDLVLPDGDAKRWARYDSWTDMPFRESCKFVDILVIQGSSFTAGQAFSSRTYDELNAILYHRVGIKGKVTFVIDRHVENLPSVQQYKALEELRASE